MVAVRHRRDIGLHGDGAGVIEPLRVDVGGVEIGRRPFRGHLDTACAHHEPPFRVIDLQRTPARRIALPPFGARAQEGEREEEDSENVFHAIS